jgi:hypothetical protein
VYSQTPEQQRQTLYRTRGRPYSTANQTPIPPTLSNTRTYRSIPVEPQSSSIPDQPQVQNALCDPYAYHDRASRRVVPDYRNSGPRPLEWDQKVDTGPAKIIKQFVDNFKILEHRSEDVPGDHITNLQLQQTRTLSGAVNLLAGHVNAHLWNKQHKAQFIDPRVEDAVEVRLGSLYWVAIFEPLMDSRVPVNCLDRVNSAHGRGICKERPCIIINFPSRNEVGVIAGYGKSW